jgi:HlyD family secretion protein
MTVSVDLTVASKREALTLPSEAVRAAALVSPWVWVVENERVVRREVTLGIQGEGAVEIASGLPEGAEVVLRDGHVFKSGQRVRTERQ